MFCREYCQFGSIAGNPAQKTSLPNLSASAYCLVLPRKYFKHRVRCRGTIYRAPACSIASTRTLMTTLSANSHPIEPWLRGTLQDVPAFQRAVLHALELAREDLSRWCGGLRNEELNERPSGLPPVAFHLRHIARSLDRLLSYAEGRDLSEKQLAELSSEQASDAGSERLFAELASAFEISSTRVRAFSAAALEEPRKVGRKQLPTTLAGLLVHIADHTQRHTGQAITTAKLLLAARAKP